MDGPTNFVVLDFYDTKPFFYLDDLLLCNDNPHLKPVGKIFWDTVDDFVLQDSYRSCFTDRYTRFSVYVLTNTSLTNIIGVFPFSSLQVVHILRVFM